MALSLLAGCTGNKQDDAADTKQTVDFEKDDSSFTPIFADYPAGSGVWTAVCDAAGEGECVPAFECESEREPFMERYPKRD